MNLEASPQLSEPLLARDTDTDEIICLGPRNKPTSGRVKPTMRVDASMLRESRLRQTLPEFLDKMARANMETETQLAQNPDGSGFELDDATAAKQSHVAMDIYPGMIEAQQGEDVRRIILPGGEPIAHTPYDDDVDNYADHSGNESEISTSTTASHHANARKRKAGRVGDGDQPENKIRIASQPSQSPGMVTRSSSPALSTSSSSSGGPTRIIKIKVPPRSSSESSSPASPVLEDPPTAITSSGCKIKPLRRSSSASSSAGSSASSRIIKIKNPQWTPPAESRPNSQTGSRSASTGKKFTRIVVKTSSNSSPARSAANYTSSETSGSARKRIKIVLRNRGSPKASGTPNPNPHY